MTDLFRHQHLETRWACAENPRGAKGGACAPDNRLYTPHTHMAHDRKTSPCLSPLRAGQCFVMAESAEGPGCLRRIWVTLSDRSPRMLRGLRIDISWDGSSEAAVSAPLGDFFGQMSGRMSAFESELFSSPEGKSFNCIVPMPFRSGFRMTVTNESGHDLDMFFYEVDWTLGDRHDDDTLWCHCHWRRENPTTLRQDFCFLPRLQGRGRYLGASFGVLANQVDYQRSWWGEGEVKIFLDGDTAQPTLCGTGTEDYIGTGWGQGRYSHRFQGCQFSEPLHMIYSFYRLHIPDPVYFQREIRATIQQIGNASPYAREQLRRRGQPVFHADQPADFEHCGNFERQDDWSSCTWFYLDRPCNGLPPLAPAAERMVDLDKD